MGTYTFCAYLKTIMAIRSRVGGHVAVMREMRNKYILFRKKSEWLLHLMNRLVPQTNLFSSQNKFVILNPHTP